MIPVSTTSFVAYVTTTAGGLLLSAPQARDIDRQRRRSAANLGSAIMLTADEEG